MDKEIFIVYKDNRIFRKDGNFSRGALWEISNLGNVRRNGDAYIPYEMRGGYLAFGSKYYVHRAVAELFLSNPENKKTIDHINRIRTDNRVCNLRWATMEEQNENRDIDAIRKANLGNKNALGCRRSEETKAKLRAAMIGNKYALGHRLSEEAKAKISVANIGNKTFLGRRHSEEAKAKNRAAHLGRRHSEEAKAKISAANIGNKHTLGRVWVFNPTTEHRTLINPSQLNDYLTKGYVRGGGRRRSGGIGKVWVINPTTEHSTRVNPSQLPEYLSKGYIRGMKIKK